MEISILFLIIRLSIVYNLKIKMFKNNMTADTTVLYADYVLNETSNDMFVITPEGNRFRFDAPIYSETHEDTTIVDPWSHKTYIVVFDE